MNEFIDFFFKVSTSLESYYLFAAELIHKNNLFVIELLFLYVEFWLMM